MAKITKAELMAEEVRVALVRKGMTQQKLAEICDINPQTLSNHLTLRQVPFEGTYEKYLRVINNYIKK
jgi:transcriptional regulator with XRE-family HTH domain